MGTSIGTIRSLALLIVIGVGAIPASAQTALKVEVGWGARYRLGRWAPVFLTVSDDRPRAVMIEVYIPHDQIHGMVIRQFATIGPTETTYALYAPFPNSMQSISVTIRADGPFGKRLAGWSAEEQQYSPTWGGINPVALLIGVSGHGANVDHLLQVQFGDPSQSNDVAPTLRWMSTPRLPTSAIGYDALDALFLDEPDLTRMSVEQQEAVIDWVRAGGHVICWIGTDAPPASSPILDLLPAEVGSNIALDLSADALTAAGLPTRFRNVKARQLTQRPGAQVIKLFGGEVNGFRRSLGFGTLAILPLNPSTLMFQTPAHATSFWEPIAGDAVTLKEKTAKPGAQQYYSPYNDSAQQRRSQAVNAAMEQLGNVPGAGSFGFGYVATVMIGLMLVVGPVDWIVLKRLNRQPWTWVTTTGWIALVSIGAVYIGYVFKSGDLHFRTLQLFDQVDGMVQARIDAAAVYSPRTQDYALKVDPEGWWQPMSTEYYGTASRAFNDIYFRQDQHGTRAGPMRVNVWNLQFLEGQTIGPSQPLIDADLRIEKKDGADHVIGTVTNRGSAPLNVISIRVKNRMAAVAPTAKAEPGSSLSVDVALSQEISYSSDDEVVQPYQARGKKPTGFQMDPLWDLAPQRSGRIDQILKDRDDLACVYATEDGTPTPVQLDAPGALEKHSQYIRALVPLKRGQ